MERPTRIKRYRRLIAVGALVCLAMVIGFLVWKQGTPYQQPYWSPNHEYYVQKYSNLMPSRFIPGMPGHGSDAIGGYIRLYDKDGKLLDERLQGFIRDIEPQWSGNKVYLKGIPEMDNHPWKLPSSSE
jgi:hypothetical protein